MSFCEALPILPSTNRHFDFVCLPFFVSSIKACIHCYLLIWGVKYGIVCTSQVGINLSILTCLLLCRSSSYNNLNSNQNDVENMERKAKRLPRLPGGKNWASGGSAQMGHFLAAASCFAPGALREIAIPADQKNLPIQISFQWRSKHGCLVTCTIVNGIGCF